MLCRSDCSGVCLSGGNDSVLSSPVTGRHFTPRDLDVTDHTPGCHEDTCCVAKSLLIHDDVITSGSGCNNSTTASCAGGTVRCCGSSPLQARLIYDASTSSRQPNGALVSTSYTTNNVVQHANVVFSSKPPDQLQHPCDCAMVNECDDDDDDDGRTIRRLARPPGDDDVQYYVIDRRKLASTLRLAPSATLKRTSAAAAATQDVKQPQFGLGLGLRTTATPRATRTTVDNGGTLTAHGECRPLLVLPASDCCRSQPVDTGQWRQRLSVQLKLTSGLRAKWTMLQHFLLSAKYRWCRLQAMRQTSACLMANLQVYDATLMADIKPYVRQNGMPSFNDATPISGHNSGLRQHCIIDQRPGTPPRREIWQVAFGNRNS